MTVRGKSLVVALLALLGVAAWVGAPRVMRRMTFSSTGGRKESSVNSLIIWNSSTRCGFGSFR